MVRRLLCSFLLLCFTLSSALPNTVYAQALALPAPGTLVGTSETYVPVIMKGLSVKPENPLLFDFIVDTGNSGLKPGTADDAAIKAEFEKLVKYFLASLTLPEKDQWVNLSPYEKDRMMSTELEKTELGRDMLAQDYLLKQVTASLIYPEKELGKEFWARVYSQAREQYGSTEIPVDTFNKVWVVADKANVYVNKNTAFVVGSHLKVMLESDYLAAQEVAGTEHKAQEAQASDGQELAKQIVREVVLPALETEVNTGKNFANLRQIFHSMILATWYKKNLKEALLTQVYADKNKTSGVERNQAEIDPQAIYAKYVDAYKKGVFNFIKEDQDPATGEMTPRKYFSGGIPAVFNVDRTMQVSNSPAFASEAKMDGDAAQITVAMDRARLVGDSMLKFNDKDESIGFRNAGEMIEHLNALQPRLIYAGNTAIFSLTYNNREKIPVVNGVDLGTAFERFLREKGFNPRTQRELFTLRRTVGDSFNIHGPRFDSAQTSVTIAGAAHEVSAVSVTLRFLRDNVMPKEGFDADFTQIRVLDAVPTGDMNAVFASVQDEFLGQIGRDQFEWQTVSVAQGPFVVLRYKGSALQIMRIKLLLDAKRAFKNYVENKLVAMYSDFANGADSAMAGQARSMLFVPSAAVALERLKKLSFYTAIPMSEKDKNRVAVIRLYQDAVGTVVAVPELPGVSRVQYLIRLGRGEDVVRRVLATFSRGFSLAGVAPDKLEQAINQRFVSVVASLNTPGIGLQRMIPQDSAMVSWNDVLKNINQELLLVVLGPNLGQDGKEKVRRRVQGMIQERFNGNTLKAFSPSAEQLLNALADPGYLDTLDRDTVSVWITLMTTDLTRAGDAAMSQMSFPFMTEDPEERARKEQAAAALREEIAALNREIVAQNEKIVAAQALVDRNEKAAKERKVWDASADAEDKEDAGHLRYLTLGLSGMETKLQDLNRRLTELDAAMTGQTPTSKVVASKKDREEIIALLGKDFNRVVTKFNDQIRIVEIWRTSNPEVLPLYARLPREDVHGFAGEVIEGFIKSLPNGAGASLIGVPTMGWLIQFNSYFPFKDIEELTGNFNSYLAGIAGEQRDGQIILPQGSAVIRIGQWGQATPVVRIRFGGKEYNLTLWEQPDGGLRGPYTPGITVKDINDQLQNTRIPLRMAHGDNGVLRLENTSKDGELILTLSGRMTFIDGKFVTVDSAETAEVPGGIDMNAGNMTMNEQGQKVDMQFDPAMVEEFRRGDFSGVRPVILNITPITNIRPFLGLAPEAVGTPLADAGSVSSAVRRESEV